jgi:hypothetical protein
MGVTFQKDEKGKYWWLVCAMGDDDDDESIDLIHKSHKGFPSEEMALDNLLANHAIMAIFVASIASRRDKGQDILFEEASDGTYWAIKSDGSGYIGRADRPAIHIAKSADDLIIIYASLAMYVSVMANKRFL